VVKLAAFADERGDSLVEILIAVAIIAIVVTAFLAALSTGVFGVSVVHERVTAENLARAQLEYIKNYTYTVGATSYPIVEHPEDYSITIGISYWYSPTGTFTTDPSDDHDCCGMQWITVTVSYNGEPVFRALDYKLNR
jgi:prepilin-type N-terminal cleavage/methylation domain-containing protein